MSFTLPRVGGPSPLMRILKSNLTLRPRLPVTSSSMHIKSSPFSSHALLSRLRTSSSTNLGNFGVSRRPGCVDSAMSMYRPCMQGVRLSSTLDGAGTQENGVKQGHGEDEVVKVKEAVEKKTGVKQGHGEDEAVTLEEAVEEVEEKDAGETEEDYKARFPAIHEIEVKKKGQKGKGDDWEMVKAFVTLQGRKQGGYQPRVWVSFSEVEPMEEVVALEWPTGKEGATKGELFDQVELKHDVKFDWPLGEFMKYQVVEKTLKKGDRRIWREVIQKRTD